MNHETLIAIMGAFDGSALTRLEYTQGDTRILLEKAAVSLPVPPAVEHGPGQQGRRTGGGSGGQEQSSLGHGSSFRRTRPQGLPPMLSE